jgi:hypothetical protein
VRREAVGRWGRKRALPAMAVQAAGRHRRPCQRGAERPARARPPQAGGLRQPRLVGLASIPGEAGPRARSGLGCFWFIDVLGFFIVLTRWSGNWPFADAFLLFVVIGLLLLTGQSVIFLLPGGRGPQGPRRPLASPTRAAGRMSEGPAGAAAGPAAPGTLHPSVRRRRDGAPRMPRAPTEPD